MWFSNAVNLLKPPLRNRIRRRGGKGAKNPQPILLSPSSIRSSLVLPEKLTLARRALVEDIAGEIVIEERPEALGHKSPGIAWDDRQPGTLSLVGRAPVPHLEIGRAHV